MQPPNGPTLRHRLINLAAALSLLFCLASLATWVIGHVWPLDISAGDVRVRTQYGPFPTQVGRLWVQWTTPYQPAPSSSISHFLLRGRFAMVVFIKTQNVRPSSSGLVQNVICDLYVPLWELAMAFSLAPAVWAIRWTLARRRRGSPAGLCPACGYDLRATPNRCPECGGVPVPSRVIKSLEQIAG